MMQSTDTTENKRAKTTERPTGKCRWCGRSAHSCWVMPCLELDNAIQKEDDRAMRRWARCAGVRLAKRGRPL